MKPLQNLFWAKHRTGDAGTVVAWHSLEAHSADVAAVAQALLSRTILRRRLAHLLNQPELLDGQISRLCVLAALHDAGKANHGFQDHAFDQSASRTGHVSPFIDFMDWDGEEKAAIIDALDLRGMVEWFDCEDDLVAILLATFSHHGRPVRPTPHFVPNLWRTKAGRNPVDEIGRLRQKANDWFPDAAEPSLPPFPHSTEFQHVLNGILMLADWIGSDERFFPYSDDDGERMSFARQRAKEAVVEMGLEPDRFRAGMGTGRPGFSDILPSEYSPHPVQKACADLVDHDNGSLTILESDTGSGKTEAALVRFLQLFHAGLVDGMYFALPTRTSAVQMHSRIVVATRRAFPDARLRPSVVLAVPEYLAVDDEKGQLLAPFRVLWTDDERERFRYRGWAAERPKRYLAGVISVGTIDQVLLSTLQVNHAHLRASALLRHLLVVDEVHASDTYMGRLLEEVLKHHLKAGGHALLMSATLGTAAQARLLSAVPAPPPAKQVAEEMPYPLISYTDAERKDLRRIAPGPSGYSKCVRVEACPIASNSEEIARIAVVAAEAGARVLVIRNTVRDCISSQRALETIAGEDRSLLFRAEGIAAPHHSRFAGPDRKRLDRAIEETFGKGSRRNGVIAVATQTVQQSLDLDADLLLSDLCPMDVLLQRIGRLHRHPGDRPIETRPAHYRQARTVVLVPEKRSLAPYIRGSGRALGPHGLGTVYEDLRAVEATWRLIEECHTWEIPAMNRHLVEGATHPEALANIVGQLQGLWSQHETYILGIRGADRSHGDLVLLPRHRPFGEELFPTDLNERIKTRLGEGDRRVTFEPGIESPFGTWIKELTLPAHYVPDGVEGETADRLDTKDRVLRFVFAGRAFTYDRLGLRPDDTDQKEESKRA